MLSLNVLFLLFWGFWSWYQLFRSLSLGPNSTVTQSHCQPIILLPSLLKEDCLFTFSVFMLLLGSHPPSHLFTVFRGIRYHSIHGGFILVIISLRTHKKVFIHKSLYFIYGHKHTFDIPNASIKNMFPKGKVTEPYKPKIVTAPLN